MIYFLTTEVSTHYSCFSPSSHQSHLSCLFENKSACPSLLPVNIKNFSCISPSSQHSESLLLSGSFSPSIYSNFCLFLSPEHSQSLLVREQICSLFLVPQIRRICLTFPSFSIQRILGGYIFKMFSL